MKRMVNKILMLSVLPILWVACAPNIRPEQPSTEPQQKEDVVPEGMMKMQFTADIADMTKASIVGTGVKFSETDKIAVYDGVLANEFSVKSITSGAVVFEGLVSKGATEFCAVYPYAAAPAHQPQGGEFTFEFPAVQRVDKAHPTDETALISIAEVDKVGHLRFRNVASVVTLAIPEGARKVTLKGHEDLALAGTCSVRIGEVPASATEHSVTLLPLEEGGKFAAGNYNVCTLPVHVQNGLTIIYEDDNQVAQASVNGAMELARTSQLDLTAAIKEIVWIRNFIHDAQELREFANAASGYSAGEIVGITADIDLGYEEWVPFDLVCTLDGLGHKISGINVSTTNSRCGFIGTLKANGILKNVVLGSSDGVSYDGSSAVTYTGSAAAYQGGVVSDCLGTLENVKSFIAVNHTTSDPGNRIGGLVGNINQGGKIVGCEYAGTMTLANNTGSATHMAGGIVGRMHNGLANAVTIKDTKFTGVINNADQKMEAVGGFVGIMQGGKIANCESAGVINMDFDGSYAYAGGFVGFYQSYASSYTAEVTNCVNTTAINSTQRLAAAAGIVAYAQRGSTGPLKIDGCTNHADIKLLTAPTALTCLGGIIGLTQDVSNDVMKVKLTLTNNTNNGKVGTEISGTNVELRYGGIAGYICGTVAFELSGNTNNGEIVALGRSVTAGGIVGRLAAPGTVMAGNTNTADVTVNSSNQWNYAAGITAFVGKTLTMTGCVNTANVKVTSPNTSDNYTAGLVGLFSGSNDSANRNVLNISECRTTGTLSSPGRAGLIFSALGGGTYVNCTLSNVGVGGSLNGTVITAGNYSSYLWSYTNNTYHSVTGAGTCKYVE